MTANMWEYRQPVVGRSLTGYEVEGLDGEDIGKVASTNVEVNAQSIVLDTGPWILGHKVMLPAGIITEIDHGTRRVFVNATREQVKEAPEYDPDAERDETFMEKTGGYYRDLIH